jgi:hypothetical protein
MEEDDRIYEIYERSHETLHDISKGTSYDIPNTSMVSNNDYSDTSKVNHPSEIYIRIASIKDDIENMTEDEFRKLELDLGIDRRSSILSSSCEENEDDDDDDDEVSDDEYDVYDVGREEEDYDNGRGSVGTEEYDDDNLPYSSLVTTPLASGHVVENTSSYQKSARMSSSPLLTSAYSRKISVPPISVHYERTISALQNMSVDDKESQHASPHEWTSQEKFPTEKVDWIEKKQIAMAEGKTIHSQHNAGIIINNLKKNKDKNVERANAPPPKKQTSKPIQKIKNKLSYDFDAVKTTRSFETLMSKEELRIDAMTQSNKPLSRLSAPKIMTRKSLNFDNIIKKHAISTKDMSLLHSDYDNKDMLQKHTISTKDMSLLHSDYDNKDMLQKHTISTKDMSSLHLDFDNKDMLQINTTSRPVGPFVNSMLNSKATSETGKSSTSVFATKTAVRLAQPVKNILIPKSTVEPVVDNLLKPKKPLIPDIPMNNILAGKIIIPKDAYLEEIETTSQTTLPIPVLKSNPIEIENIPESLSEANDEPDGVQDLDGKVEDLQIDEPIGDSDGEIPIEITEEIEPIEDSDGENPIEIIEEMENASLLVSSLPNLNPVEILTDGSMDHLDTQESQIDFEKSMPLVRRNIVKKKRKPSTKPIALEKLIASVSANVHREHSKDEILTERYIKPKTKQPKTKQLKIIQPKLKLPAIQKPDSQKIQRKMRRIEIVKPCRIESNSPKKSVIPGFNFKDIKYEEEFQYKIEIEQPEQSLVVQPSSPPRTPSPVYLPLDVELSDLNKLMTVKKTKIEVASLKPKPIPKKYITLELIDDNKNNTPFDDWLAKWCIFNANQLKVLENVFNQHNYADTQCLTGEAVLLALDQVLILNNLKMVYLERILSLCDMDPFRKGANKRTFCVIAALAQRIEYLDDVWFNGFLPKLDMISIENKVFKVRKLWDFLVNEDTKLIKVDDLLIEMKAGGVSTEHIKHASEKFSGSPTFDLLDYLAYCPLFVAMHEKIVRNPFDPMGYI